MAKMFRVLVSVVLVAIISYLLYERDTFDPESIRGKRVLITGASSGIGEQLAYHYCTLGASVLLTARRENLLRDVASKCKELGAAKVGYVVADMGRPVDRSKVVNETEKRLGGLDHLILNHAMIGVFLWKRTPENMTALQQMLNVNFVSYVDLASKFHDMLSASKGNIGVVSSVGGKIPTALFQSYSATKHALQGFFSAYREEQKLMESGISVTLCVLGIIDTETARTVNKFVFPNNAYLFHVSVVSPSGAAEAIVKGVTVGNYEIYYPFIVNILVSMHKFVPNLVVSFISSVLFHST